MKNKETYSKGVAKDQEKHTGEQGEFFTFDGTDNLGVTDMFVDDGFDIIHQHRGKVHLSDLSPEESETAIPQGTKKVKKVVNKPNLSKAPFNIGLNEALRQTKHINPELEEGDKIIVINNKSKAEIQSGFRDYFPGQEPKLYERYIVFKKQYSGHKAKHPYHYFLVPDIPKYQNLKLDDSSNVEIDDHGDIKALFPWLSGWILDKEDVVTEHKTLRQTKNLNPQLMIGDEILVVSHGYERAPNKGPELYRPYQVVSIKQSNDTQETYYGLYPLEQTDDNLLASILAGGGKPREILLYQVDNWILRPGFRRGELEEEGETNEAARTLSKARKAGVDIYYPKSAVKANPERFRKYTRDKYLNENNINSGLNPVLEKGDIIRVLDVDGEHAKMPVRFGVYLVQAKGDRLPDGEWYLLHPIDHMNSPNRLLDVAYMYRGDAWIKIGDNIFNEGINEEVIPSFTNNPKINDDKLNIPADKFTEYLNNFWREKLIKEATPIIECLEYNCYGGWKQDPDAFDTGLELERDKRYTADQYCNDCGQEFDEVLSEIDKQIVKLGLVKMEYENNVLQKPFPFTYNRWIDNVIKEINPKYFIDNKEEVNRIDGDNLFYESNIISESINDMVYIKKPRKKHLQKMDNTLGNFKGFNLKEFKNTPPPKNDSKVTEDEIKEVQKIKVNKKFVDTTDDIHEHFEDFLKTKDIEYPKKEVNKAMKGLSRIILELKYHYNRPRPEQIAEKKKIKLKPTTLDTASTPSYPSGHALRGRFMGRYLSEKYPEYKKELMILGDDIGDGRLMAKVHYPSDNKFGKKIGDKLYKHYMKQNDLKLNEQEEPSKDEVSGIEYGTFTRKDIIILNYLSKRYTKDELMEVWGTSSTWGKPKDKWLDIMKLFGVVIDSSRPQEWVRSSRYAKWAYDNWDTAEEYDFDYGKVPNPIKAKLKWYDVDMEETGTQVEYKSGTAEVMGYDEDDAAEKAGEDFWSWGGEMETFDWGDYESHDSEVTNVDFLRMDESKKEDIEEDLENWGYDGEELGPLEEQVMMKTGDMLKSDIFKFLSHRFSLTPAESGEIKDHKGNYYRLIDMEQPQDYVTLSHLIDPVVEFVNYGVKSGTFEESDIQKGIEAITEWLSLSMNQKTDYIN